MNTPTPYHSRASVVVIGAGIVGCSAAYHLARSGVRDVVVLDQGSLFATGGSSSHAPGLIFQLNASKVMAELAGYSKELYGSLRLDGQPCYFPVGSLEVAQTPERWLDLSRKLGWAASWGVEACLLSPSEARDRLPLLDADQIHGALWVPSDGVAKAVRAAEALARDAEARGAAFHGDTPVTGIEVEAGVVRAVVTPNGRIAAERVLICAGIWGPKVGRLAGVSIPLVPVQHQYAYTTPLRELRGETREHPQAGTRHPILRHQDRAMYFRQHGDRYGVGSYQHEPLLVDPEEIRPHAAAPPMPSVLPFTEEHFAAPWADALRLLPALREVELAERFNGLFSFTPDGLPLIGESADVRGLWVAEAVWVTHAGGVGKVVAEWMTEGEPRLDLHECDLNRFEPYAHSRAYVRARGAQQYREVYDVIHPRQQLEQPRPVRVSPFHARQQALGAVFFEGRGWERPQWYGANEDLLGEYDTREWGPLGVRVPAPRSGWSGRHWSPIEGAEHLATRERVALYDMSPLPKLEVAGPGALAFLDGITTNRLDKPVGAVTYTLMLTERGGVASDLTVARLGDELFQVGCNGPLDLLRLRRRLPCDGTVQVRDVTGSLSCIGLWGPRARDVVSRASADDFSNAGFRYFSARRVSIGEVPVTALRVSYVGELGWELYASAEYSARLWDVLWEAGRAYGVIAGGRGAFESLRLEKGYRLWGVDVHAEHDPYEAGLGFAVKPEKGPFVGREAVQQARAETPRRRLCCLLLDDASVVLDGKEPILAGDRTLGYVTSACYGYTVGASIAYGYLPSECAAEGARVEVRFFDRSVGATVARDPLYDPKGERLRG